MLVSKRYYQPWQKIPKMLYLNMELDLSKVPQTAELNPDCLDQLY